MKNILYLHGYGGSANGSTVKMLKRVFPDCSISSIEMNFKNPDKLLKDYFEAGVFDYIVASSFGAFFAGMVQGNGKKILINPALPYDICRLDGTYNPEKALELMKKNYSYKDGELAEETYFIFGTEDEIVNNREFYEKLFNKKNMFEFEMGHKLTEKCATTLIKDLIEEK